MVPGRQALALSSGDGVFSDALTPGSPVVVHSRGELNLEWSASEVSWQPEFPPGAPTESEAAAASESPGPIDVVGSQLGTVSVSVESHSVDFASVVCQDLGNGQLRVTSGAPKDDDAVALVIGSDGAASSLSGEIRGVMWTVTQNPTVSLRADGSGTFSGKDAISGEDVAGTFACR